MTVQAMIERRGQASGPTRYLPSEAPPMPMRRTLGARERPLHCT
jgi:hypothetical protein